MSRVLIYDLETGGVNALKSDLGFVLCFGYKWLGDKKTHCLTLADFDGFRPGEGYSDKALVSAAAAIMDEADLLVAHYGDWFDRKFINGRLVINGLPPIPPTKQIDTCRMAWKHFNFHGNRLKQLAATLGCKNRKADNEFPGWWLRVLAGDLKALDLMAQYCKQDVRTLEEVYLRMRPFMPEHPRLRTNRVACRHCGAPTQSRGIIHTKDYAYRRLACTRCGSWDRQTQRLKEGEE